jgi:hypothetical protein
MIGGTPTQGEPKFIAWGTNPNALTAAATDVALFAESTEARTSGSSSQVTTTTTNDTVQWTGTQTATGTRSIQEVGLLDSATQPAQGTVAAGGVVGSNSSTALNTSAAFSPGNNNYVQIRTEVMQVTAGSGTTALTVVRGQNGSAAISTIAANDNIAPGNPPGQTGISGGNLFVHADLTTISLNNGDSISWTIKLQFV